MLRGVQRRARPQVCYGLSVLIVTTASATALAIAPPAPDTLTEFVASSWDASADAAQATVHDDTTRVVAGSASLRFETNGCFDTALWAPITQDGAWDLLSGGAGGLSFWVYAENDDGFQNYSPTVRLAIDPFDYVEYRPAWDLLNSALGQWLYVEIPLNGDALWTRTDVGFPDLTYVNYVEIHNDTWGCTFTLWFDDLRFDVPLAPPEGLLATAGNHQVALEWKPFVDLMGTFQHYAVYRDTAAFTDTNGMTPIGVADSGLSDTTYLDTTAENGVAYHYAVTAVLSGGETTNVTSVGPRKPRNETDLQVTHIARTPRHPRYWPDYTYFSVTEPGGFGPYVYSSATGLGGGQTAATKRWPNVGETVTYVAYVRNRGTNVVSTTLSGTWRVDGNSVATPSQAVNLGPGAVASFSYPRTWDGQWHSVTFTLNYADARAGNNSREIWTKSAPFLTYVDQGAIEDFRDRTSPQWPQAATDDLIDWLQRHMDRMNAMFIAKGSPKRVHYDHLVAIHDYDADPPTPETINFGVFPFRYYGATIGDPRSPGYYHANVDIDYGLCHEQAHQLGLIDIYQLGISPEMNQVSGLPYSPVECLMTGCSPFLSDHSAGGMTHWADIVHGYYGQYMYQMPQHVRLRILDYYGDPLPGATVKMYQVCERPGLGKVITNQIKAQGTTDASGYWTLPNVPISSTGNIPTTVYGDTLPDNPFGWLAVVGTNAVLHFKVEYEGFVDYCWLDVTEVNVAYWQGQTSVATFERQLAIGGDLQPFPPPELTELNAVNWSNWVQGGTGSITDDATRKKVGAASIKFVTNGGFDNFVRYPLGLLANWDLRDVTALKFWAYAVNPNPGFQSYSPTLRLGSYANGHFEYRPAWDVLNAANNQWYYFDVPLAGDGFWTRTTSGTPDLGSINYVELHADTWDYGFTLWLDGMRFVPYPGPLGDMNCDGHTTFADIDPFVTALSGPTTYYGQFPECNWILADTNCDGGVTFADIDPFVACLGGACRCP